MPTTPSDDAPRRTTGGFRSWIEQRFGLATESGAPAPDEQPPDPNHNPEATRRFYATTAFTPPETHHFTEGEFFAALEGLRHVHQVAAAQDGPTEGLEPDPERGARHSAAALRDECMRAAREKGDL